MGQALARRSQHAETHTGTTQGTNADLVIKGFHVGDARIKKLTPASKMCDQSGLII